MKLQLAYLTSDLNSLLYAPFGYHAPLVGAEAVYQPLSQLTGTAIWKQVSHHPLAVRTTVPIVNELKFIKGFIDVDQAGTLDLFFADTEQNVIDPPAAGSAVRATITIPIPLNAVGQGTIIRVEMPSGKFVRVRYTNLGVAQARFCMMLNLCSVEVD